jgi:hypothetical protein
VLSKHDGLDSPWSITFNNDFTKLFIINRNDKFSIFCMLLLSRKSRKMVKNPNQEKPCEESQMVLACPMLMCFTDVNLLLNLINSLSYN